MRVMSATRYLIVIQIGKGVNMIAFIVGLFVGSVAGVVCMALAFAARDD